MANYIPFTDEQREQARQTDLVAFLRQCGEIVKPSGSEFQWNCNGQKVTIRGNVWYNQYEQFGGDAISFAQHFYDYSYYDALLADSMVCNSLLWPNTEEWTQDVTQLRSFLAERAEYLNEEIAKWSADTPFELPESLFADVDENAWYFEDVHKAVKYGLMAGGGGDAFYPTQNAIRAHVIQTIYNMVGRPAVEFSDPFTDVKQHAEHANAVSWAVQNGVLVESPDGLFGPTEQTPREEVVVYLYRYLGSPEADGAKLNEYADADTVSDDAREAMEWAAESDLLAVENNEIRPTDAITRAELASILVRFYERFMSN